MKVAFITLGCRVNQYETEAMAEKFIKEGFKVVNHNDAADVYVINTCTVTNMGDRKSRQMISKVKKLNTEAVIAVVGCYSQIASEEISQIDGVDVILGTKNKGQIVYFVNRAINEKNQIIAVNDIFTDKNFEELNIEEYQDRTRAFLKIQDGCNRFCSYCLIPYARGGVCSKDPEKVLEEVNKLADHGFKEIILSGIHTASYGIDIEGNWNLVRLLEEIENIQGIDRVRIGSIDPTFFTEGVIEKIAALKKLCPHFHLSLQSGCDETLRRMNRKYTSEEYKNIVVELRKNIEDVSITTDVIVGFPGEDESEFDSTYKFLSEIKLSKMHIFKYSPREGTKAAKMKEQVDGAIKELRSKTLIELNDKLEKEFINRFIGRKMKVLYEDNFKGINNLYEGYTPNYIKVISKCDNNICSEVLETKLLKMKDEHLIGEIL
ncbi:tRNA (N(6)-L-threonylcarbamoyladenosine(37)-C(2))-methylthiotransferase MtaB [Clostridium pasteurianum]|uniref:tRNA (N(6)-L-threonylcarbamoyladenosine(37)-C(2))- methylthiotransferase MtaB n=1 Tax=Clostridium pasteurianum TaxID=1501 RepID=UPI002260FBF5|nr:tRNA (N(6)-L-threonylcarbamoyladenosine(37)-C(2))-methylthiotransferase MtaB [Clostridium pasteurianum]UZW12644.1 tRNA (N(6)-L-threonylcarbamoyladenosine(37)-C(2))-methylthiotransferase MtaB [Clostridium pasteurianum]